MSTLNPYFYAYNPELLAFENAWVKYLKGERVSGSIISEHIKASWERCKSYKVDPLRKEPLPRLSPEEIQARIGENEILLSIVRPLLEVLFQIVEASDFRVDFIDREGYVLYSLCGEALKPLCDKTGSYPGANRSEGKAGTTAAGLALLTQLPMQVSGAEHFIQQFHRWSCSAAPIISQEGDVLGAINVAGHYEQAHKHTLGMVTAIAKAIENELHIHLMNDRLKITNQELSAIFDIVSDGLVYVVDEKIKQVNQTMCSLLGLKEKAVLEKNVDEVIFTAPEISRLLKEQRQNHANREVVLEGRGRICNCIFEARTVEDEGANTMFFSTRA